ncbi:hypothetical protein MARI151_40020 [Maribacter litoralis]|uniref:Uncharacterized protein n=1 Tax=Maribacter litoralis TaxID=2059726 RepID=A0A653TQR3_9FLAO|nr:hypothetical protein MARI151_40020 [Maribacter litoralis]
MRINKSAFFIKELSISNRDNISNIPSVTISVVELFLISEISFGEDPDLKYLFLNSQPLDKFFNPIEKYFFSFKMK